MQRRMCDAPRTKSVLRKVPFMFVALTSYCRFSMARDIYCCLLPLHKTFALPLGQADGNAFNSYLCF